MIDLGSRPENEGPPRGYRSINGSTIDEYYLNNISNNLNGKETIIAGVELTPGLTSFFCPNKGQLIKEFINELKTAHYQGIKWYIGPVIR